MYRWYLFGLLGLFFASMHAQEGQFQLNEHAIQDQQKIIARELFWNKVERGSVNIALLSAAAYVGYRYYNGADHNNAVVCKGHGPVPSFGSWQWTKEQAAQVRNVTVQMFALSAVTGIKDFVIHRLYHPGDISWFIQTHTSVFADIELMLVYAHALDAPTDYTYAQQVYALNSLTMQTTILFKQIEALLGFIAHKKSQTRNAALQQASDETVAYIIAQANELGALCEQRVRLGYVTDNPIKIEEKIKQFSADLLTAINGYINVERNAALLAA